MSKFKTEAKTEWNGPAVIRDFDKANQKALLKSAIIVHAQAVALAPVNKTVGLGGQLKASITRALTKDNAVVGTNVEYAPYVEFGTRPHTITAKGAGLTDGTNWFGKTVNHPGTKAQPFLLPALTGNIKRIIAIFKEEGIKLKWVDKRKGFKR